MGQQVEGVASRAWAAGTLGSQCVTAWRAQQQRPRPPAARATFRKDRTWQPPHPTAASHLIHRVTEPSLPLLFAAVTSSCRGRGGEGGLSFPREHPSAESKAFDRAAVHSARPFSSPSETLVASDRHDMKSPQTGTPRHRPPALPRGPAGQADGLPHAPRVPGLAAGGARAGCHRPRPPCRAQV